MKHIPNKGYVFVHKTKILSNHKLNRQQIKYFPKQNNVSYKKKMC